MDFTSMSRTQSDAYLEQFLGEEASRLESLRGRWRAAGESQDTLDLSPQSLEPLWGWAITQIVRRDDDSLPELPSWASDRQAFTQFSNDALALVDEIARYLGRVILRTVPDSRWAVARSRNKGYVDNNWPAVAIGDGYLNPVALVRTAATGVLHDPSNTSADRLLTAYDVNTRLARERAGAHSDAEAGELPMEGPAFELASYPSHPTWDLEITLDEWVATELEEAIAELVVELARSAGVAAATHEDRERILVASGNTSRAELQTWLELWWQDKLAAYRRPPTGL